MLLIFRAFSHPLELIQVSVEAFVIKEDTGSDI